MTTAQDQPSALSLIDQIHVEETSALCPVEDVESVKREYESKIHVLELRIKELEAGRIDLLGSMQEVRKYMDGVCRAVTENQELREANRKARAEEQDLQKELDAAKAQVEEERKRATDKLAEIEAQKEVQHKQYLSIISEKETELDSLRKQLLSQQGTLQESTKGASTEVAKLQLKLSEKERMMSDMRTKHMEALAAQEQKLNKQRVRFEEKLMDLTTQLAKGASTSDVAASVQAQLSFVKESYEAQLGTLRRQLVVKAEAGEDATTKVHKKEEAKEPEAAAKEPTNEDPEK